LKGGSAKWGGVMALQKGEPTNGILSKMWSAVG
jgi:hypothetical protein